MTIELNLSQKVNCEASEAEEAMDAMQAMAALVIVAHK